MLARMPRDLDRPLFRGRYTIAAAASIYTGIPIDEGTWRKLLDRREDILAEVVAGCDCYEDIHFRLDLFGELLERIGQRKSWPRTETGILSTEDKSFRARSYIPEIEELRQIRSVVDQLSQPSFQVSGGRNYHSLIPFKTETSRNTAPGCIFQSASWLRGLIQPPVGRGMAYIDFSAEEFLIAGVLSDDSAIRAAYAGGDPYIGFGQLAGTIPAGATKHSHPK